MIFHDTWHRLYCLGCRKALVINIPIQSLVSCKKDGSVSVGVCVVSESLVRCVRHSSHGRTSGPQWVDQ